MRRNLKTSLVVLIGFLFIFAFCSETLAQKLKTPRFSSLRSSEINLRTGPGLRYPIDWVYKKRDLPVEVIEEFDDWRKIRDFDGTIGWVHSSMVSSRRYGVISKESLLLKNDRDDKSVIASLDPKVIVKIISCPKNKDRCRVETQGYHGFTDRSAIWGVFDNEYFD